jgi:D-arabinose 5-phosphate isomerase GutQ
VVSKDGSTSGSTDSVFVLANRIRNMSAALTSVAIIPNPFTSNSSIQLSLPKASQVTITLFDVTGRKVGTLAEGTFNGKMALEVDSDKLSLKPGMYFTVISVDGA